MEIKEYNIKGNNWHKVRIFLLDNKIKDMTCDCIWSLNNQDAWKEGKTLCFHIQLALRQLYLETRKKKRPKVEGFKTLPDWLRKKYLSEVDHCQRCASKENLEIHRIKRGNKGGLYTICSLKHPSNNVKILCGECHDLIHSNEPGMR